MIASVDETALESALVARARERRQSTAPRTANLTTSGSPSTRLGDEARIEVADRGIGIPARERERVFEGFYRASNAGTRRGAGLGLNLVRRFAEGHGGRAEALPRDGGGTIVRIFLPSRDETTADAEDLHPGDRRRTRPT